MTGDLDINQLPNSLRNKYKNLEGRNHKIQLALEKSYILLSELDGEPLGELYLKQAQAIKDKLKIRNYSILAHGFQPISVNHYQEVREVFTTFIKASLAAIVPPNFNPSSQQFPQSLNF